MAGASGRSSARVVCGAAPSLDRCAWCAVEDGGEMIRCMAGLLACLVRASARGEFWEPCRSRSERRQVATMRGERRGAAVRDPPLGGLGNLFQVAARAPKLARKRSSPGAVQVADDGSGPVWIYFGARGW